MSPVAQIMLGCIAMAFAVVFVFVPIGYSIAGEPGGIVALVAGFIACGVVGYRLPDWVRR